MDLVGNEKSISAIKDFLLNFKNQPKKSILISGPPGVGKTTIAKIIANEMKTNIKIIQGPEIKEKVDLINLLYSIKEKDILFIDEIHSLEPMCYEMLYSVMEDFVMNINIAAIKYFILFSLFIMKYVAIKFINIGKDFNAKVVSLQLPKFTIIGATTKLGNLPDPFEERFGIVEHIEPYSNKEIYEILKFTTSKCDIKMNKSILNVIANHSKGIPRISKRILSRFNDHYSYQKEEPKIILKKIGIFELGLNSIDLNYLKAINTNKKMGIKSLSQILNIDEKTIINKIEPYLIQLNFVTKDSNGRSITKYGKDYLDGL